ncbi:hypothetical protein CPT_Sansa88 [Caulobacter phage Sansa]|uniref:Uncharacterized protein n=1 Tax=Caulobacter phage Sansa TaxID=1675600 RepID=A0A0K1LLV3_9CAUD|nr:hypothetical protein HOR07_gp088 [Caulobacter phage Sansa]AKU43492.1 hypothetical protein CPT_Sansa88 [Caulobacter phage Sansa]
MAGSEAEERIRALVVAAMRRRWPDARIIHELVLDQGVVRIDLAAVTEDHIALAEIKSERDVLTRLPKQLSLATKIAGETWLCTTLKHAGELDHMRWDRKAPELSAALRHTVLMFEQDGLLKPRHAGGMDAPVPDVRSVLMMLWAAELQLIAKPFGGWSKPRFWCMRAIVENMSGREIRRAVCQALRRRTFARADDPIGVLPPEEKVKAQNLFRDPAPAPDFDWQAWREQVALLGQAQS